MYVQPITFKSMQIARDQAKDLMDIELLATAYEDDQMMIPAGFKNAGVLSSTVLDHHTFHHPVKLPLIHEILEKAMQASNAEFMIYTNVDIGLYPDFYVRLKDLLDNGHDALIINRDRIEPRYTQVDELEKIWQLPGKSHPGFDCFVFHRSLFGKMQLENICIGVPFIEIGFSQNLFHLAKNFKLLKSNRYTFHIGMEIFKKRIPKEYFTFNRTEYRKAEKKIWSFMHLRNLPFRETWLP